MGGLQLWAIELVWEMLQQNKIPFYKSEAFDFKSAYMFNNSNNKYHLLISYYSPDLLVHVEYITLILPIFTYTDTFYGEHWNKNRKYFQSESIILLGPSETYFQKRW